MTLHYDHMNFYGFRKTDVHILSRKIKLQIFSNHWMSHDCTVAIIIMKTVNSFHYYTIQYNHMEFGDLECTRLVWAKIVRIIAQTI